MHAIGQSGETQNEDVAVETKYQTSEQHREELEALGIDSSAIGPARDSVYYNPTVMWLQAFLVHESKKIQSILAELQRSTGKDSIESFDCDNISRRIIANSTEYLLQNKEVAPNADHSIFSADLAVRIGKELNGIPSTPGHTTNIIRTSDCGWVFGEGETGRITPVKTAINDGLVIVYRIDR